MSEAASGLGEPISSHGISPAFLQRAAFIAILSFAFFLLMMLGFYIRQNFVYFLLATAFLLIYLMTMLGWFMQRRNLVTVYENGIKYKEQPALWHEITSVTPRGRIELENGSVINIPNTTHQFERLIQLITSRSSR